MPRLKVGDGMLASTHVGPMSSRERQQWALQHITTACAAGARLAAQAPVPKTAPLCDGYFVPPTVLVDVRPEMSIVREAVYGPIACVMPFNSADEAIAMTNDSRFGLMAVVFTKNNAIAAQLSRRLEVGAVYLNNFQRFGNTAMPVNGIKATGYGCEEHSLDTLREYTRQRVVRMPTQTDNTRYGSVVDEILAG